MRGTMKKARADSTICRSTLLKEWHRRERRLTNLMPLQEELSGQSTDIQKNTATNLPQMCISSRARQEGMGVCFTIGGAGTGDPQMTCSQPKNAMANCNQKCKYNKSFMVHP